MAAHEWLKLENWHCKGSFGGTKRPRNIKEYLGFTLKTNFIQRNHDGCSPGVRHALVLLSSWPRPFISSLNRCLVRFE